MFTVMNSPLSDQSLSKELAALPGWSIDGGALTKTFAHPEFLAAIAFVQQIAELAEKENHHPDIDIRFRRVKLMLISHDVGAITQRDIRFAKLAQELRN